MEESIDAKRKKLTDLHSLAEEGGGLEKLKKHKEQGKYNARERIHLIVDPGTFIEIDKFVKHRCTNFGMEKSVILGDGVVTGVGTVNGRQVALFSQDFSCWGGALGAAHAKKIVKIMQLAIENRIPIIGINDSGGARIQEGVESLAGYADIFYLNVKASGVIPQISIIMGPCAGGAVYSPAITDFIFMVDKSSYMFVTGPEVIKAVTHEEVSKEDLGGATTHSEKSGVCHFKCKSEDDCFERVRELLDFIPQSNFSKLEPKPTSDSVNRENRKLIDVVPANPKKPYDMKEIVLEILDDGQFLEVHKDFAKNIIVGFGSIGGIRVGVVANQPAVLAGVLDIDSSCKAARFIRFCDAFDIPLITLVDVPGFLPGTIQEFGGIIKHGSKLLYAYAEATVPLITLITRKAYGGAYDVMASKHIKADINLAYPTSEIAVMGADGAVNIVFRKELEGLTGPAFNEKKSKLVKDYEENFNNPYRAAELGYIDQVVYPEYTRERIYKYLNVLKNKKIENPIRKHGNIQL
jgi:propionyl-CoA carboxylase beta chain